MGLNCKICGTVCKTLQGLARHWMKYHTPALRERLARE